MHKIGEYQGKPTLSLQESEDSRFPFTFGPAKAILILQHIEAIREFVGNHGGEKGAAACAEYDAKVIPDSHGLANNEGRTIPNDKDFDEAPTK